jgi:hypothetical protein
MSREDDPVVQLSGYWQRRCEDFARTVVEGYRLGRKEFSRRMTLPGKPAIWGNAQVQFVGRLGEVAWCKYLGLDPDKALDWGRWCDHGADFTIGPHIVDVKSTDHAYGTKLIWPVQKNHIFDSNPFNCLALARIEENDDVRLMGVISKDRFAKECITSDGNDRLVKGTRYVPARRLRKAWQFKEMVGNEVAA